MFENHYIINFRGSSPLCLFRAHKIFSELQGRENGPYSARVTMEKILTLPELKVTDEVCIAVTVKKLWWFFYFKQNIFYNLSRYTIQLYVFCVLVACRSLTPSGKGYVTSSRPLTWRMAAWALRISWTSWVPSAIRRPWKSSPTTLSESLVTEGLLAILAFHTIALANTTQYKLFLSCRLWWWRDPWF